MSQVSYSLPRYALEAFYQVANGRLGVRLRLMHIVYAFRCLINRDTGAIAIVSPIANEVVYAR